MAKRDKAEVAASVTKQAARQRTIRCIVITAGIIVGLKFVVDGVVHVLAKSWWEALLAVLAPTVPSSGLIYWVYRKIKRRIQQKVLDSADRVAHLEEQIDPNRSSSGLAKDGSDPIEG